MSLALIILIVGIWIRISYIAYDPFFEMLSEGDIPTWQIWVSIVLAPFIYAVIFILALWDYVWYGLLNR